jgi:hypothetical protein
VPDRLVIRRSGCQSYSSRVPFTAARLSGPAAHHHQRGGRCWQVNDRAGPAAVHAVRRPDRRRGHRPDQSLPDGRHVLRLASPKCGRPCENFWAAGYVNVIAGSFLRRYSDYISFRQLVQPSAVFLVDLLVEKGARSPAPHPTEADDAGMARYGRPGSGRPDNPAGPRC